MASKVRKRKQSNLHISDESMHQPTNILSRTRVGGRVYSGIIPNQATNSQHDDSTQQNNNCNANETNDIQKIQRNSEPSRLHQSMSSKTRKTKQSKFLFNLDQSIQQPPNNLVDKSQSCKQRNSSLSSEPSRRPPTKSTRLFERQVSDGVMDNQQISDQTQHTNDSQLNDDIGWMHNHISANQAPNSEHEEPRQHNTTEISNESNDVENEDSCDEEIVQKVRGPTYMMKIWGRPSNLPLIEVAFDRFGSPVGKNKSTFIEFLGSVARNGKYCPIDVENWHKMSKDYKREMIRIVKAKFDTTLADEGWILHSINDKWRSWKSFLKKKIFWPNTTPDFLTDEKNDRVSEDQWANLVTYWNRKDVQEKSKKNKEARSKKKMDHRTGKKSFAQVSENMAKEKGRAPFRSEMFEVCYTPSNGSPSINVIEYLDSMKELKNQLPEGSHDSVGPDDIFAQVIGPDKPGYVRMFRGVSASDVWGEVPGRNTYKRKVQEQNTEISEMKSQIAELKSLVLSQQTQRSTPLPERPSGLVMAKQTLGVGDFVSLRSMFDSTKILAKGVLHSTDPNAQVGGQVLGENWCQVHIKVVLQSEEKLIRPYDYCQTLEDAHGGMVAWPCYLVTPTESHSKSRVS